MSGSLRDVYSPAEVQLNGAARGLRSATGVELIAQRILRLLFLRPGELLHRPTLGAALEDYQNKPPNTETMRQLNLRVRALLDALPDVEAYKLDIARADGAEIKINIIVSVDGANVVVPTVTLNGVI